MVLQCVETHFNMHNREKNQRRFTFANSDHNVNVCTCNSSSRLFCDQSLSLKHFVKSFQCPTYKTRTFALNFVFFVVQSFDDKKFHTNTTKWLIIRKLVNVNTRGWESSGPSRFDFDSGATIRFWNDYFFSHHLLHISFCPSMWPFTTLCF